MKTHPQKLASLAAAALAALHSCGPAPALAAVPYRWKADSSNPAAAQVPAYRGETIELAAQLTDSGAPVALSASAVATIYWQTNGMDSAWWTRPASAATNGAIAATWTPAMDSGSDRHTFFLGVAETNGVSYRANGIIAMRHAPGSPPNALPLPTQVIDFAQISVTNAPWLLAADMDGFATTNDVAELALENAEQWRAIDAISNAVPPAVDMSAYLRHTQDGSAMPLQGWSMRHIYDDQGQVYSKQMEAGIGAIGYYYQAGSAPALDASYGARGVSLYDGTSFAAFRALYISHNSGNGGANNYHYPARSGTLALKEDVDDAVASMQLFIRSDSPQGVAPEWSLSMPQSSPAGVGSITGVLRYDGLGLYKTTRTNPPLAMEYTRLAPDYLRLAGDTYLRATAEPLDNDITIRLPSRSGTVARLEDIPNPAYAQVASANAGQAILSPRTAASKFVDGGQLEIVLNAAPAGYVGDYILLLSTGAAAPAIAYPPNTMRIGGDVAIEANSVYLITFTVLTPNVTAMSATKLEVLQ